MVEQGIAIIVVMLCKDGMRISLRPYLPRRLFQLKSLMKRE